MCVYTPRVSHHVYITLCRIYNTLTAAAGRISVGRSSGGGKKPYALNEYNIHTRYTPCAAGFYTIRKENGKKNVRQIRNNIKGGCGGFDGDDKNVSLGLCNVLVYITYSVYKYYYYTSGGRTPQNNPRIYILCLNVIMYTVRLT